MMSLFSRCGAVCTLIAGLMMGCGEAPTSVDEVATTEQALGWGPEVTTVAVLPTPFNDGVSVDRRGRVFVSNAGQFGATGLMGTVVNQIGRSGTVTTALTGLNGPIGSVVDRRGNLYVSNFNDGTIVKRDRRGNMTTVATLPSSGGGLALDRKGRLYASSYTGGAIYRIERSGQVTLFSDDARLAGPVGISFDRFNNLYVGNYDDGAVLKIRPDASVSVVAQLGAAAGNNIGHLTFSRGCIYTTSINVNKIFAVSRAGAVTELAGTGDLGSVDGDLDTAQFALPNGIAANRRGTHLYVSEYGSPNVRKIRLPRTACPH